MKVVGLALVWGLFGCSSSSTVRQTTAEAVSEKDSRKLQVLFFADFHSRIGEFSRSPGLARLTSYLKESRKGYDGNTLVFSGGDLVGKGSPACLGALEPTCYQLLGPQIDFGVVGSSELKLKTKEFQALLSSQPKLLAANVATQSIPKAQQAPTAVPKYQIVKLPGTEAEIFVTGWTEPPTPGEWDPKTHPLKVTNRLIQLPEIKSLEAASGGRPWIFLSHQEYEADLKTVDLLCQEKIPVLLYLKGNSHRTVDEPRACTQIRGTDAYGRSVLRIELGLSDGSWKFKQSEFIDMAQITPDQEMQNTIQALYSAHAPKAKSVVAQFQQKKDMAQVAGLFAQAFREITKADVAIVNSGAIKDSILPGAFTEEDLGFVYPYNDALVGLDWKMRDLERSLCAATRREKDAFKDYGSDLYLSGARIEDSGLATCRVVFDRRAQSQKVVMVKFLEKRSGDWLGSDLRGKLFSFGFFAWDAFKLFASRSQEYRP